MRLGLIVAGLACIAIAMLSGCLTEELSETQRFLCIDLSSKAYAFVPECKTQEECFAKIEGELFAFDASVFSSEVQEELFYSKNNLALSWLYFNNARANLKEINKICSARSGIALLALQVNELNNNILHAFAYSDKANQHAFSVLLLEQQDLGSEKIELIKEEPLFNDFIALNNNLNDLQSNSLEGKTFASFYLVQMNSLQDLMRQTGFEKDFISEASALDFFEKYQSQIAKEAGAERILKIPFVAPVLDSFVSFLNDFFRLSSASEALAKMPAFEFLQAYHNLAGTDNSAIQKFSVLMGKDAGHRKVLLERISALESGVSEKLFSAEDKISALSEKQFVSFDKNFFSGLYSLLGQETEIATQKYSMQDFSDFRENAGTELFALKTEFFSLRQKTAVNSFSFGEKIFALKNLLEKASFLLENLDFLESELTVSLDVLCSERLAKISSFLNETSFPNEMVLKTSDLKSRIKFKIGEFNGSKETEQRLFLCRQSLEEFNEFKLALTDFEEYSLQKELFVDNCFECLEKLFSQNSEIDLSDFELRFQKIRELPQPFNDIETVSNYCSSLKQDTLGYLANHSEIISLQNDFSDSKELFEKLKLVDAYAERIVLDSLLESFESKFSRIEKYFSGEKPVFETVLPVLPELSKDLSELKESLEKELDSAIADFACKNAVIEFFSDDTRLIDTDFNSLARITLYNPFRTTGKVLLKIPFSSGESLFLPDNMYFSDNFLFADLNALFLGTSFLEFFSGRRQTPYIWDENISENNNGPKNNFQELTEEIIEKKDSALEKPIGLWRELVLSGLENDFKDRHDSLFSLNLEIEKSLGQRDFNRAAALLDSLSLNSEEFVSGAEASLKEKASKLSGRIDSFLEIASKIIPEKFALLFSVLESVPDETLYGLGYVAPVSKERLQKLELELSSVDSSGLRKEFTEFSSLVSKKQFSNAIQKFSAFEKEFEKKELQANAINSELDSLISAITGDALASVNSAASVLNSNFNSEALELLSKAKNAIEKKEFFKAIAFAKAAEQLASRQNNVPQLPVFFYPLLLGTALVFAVRYKKKQVKEKKEDFRRILRGGR